MQYRDDVQRTKFLQDLVDQNTELVASVAGQQTQGVTKYKKDVYKQCAMEMSQLQESFWRQKD